MLKHVPSVSQGKGWKHSPIPACVQWKQKIILSTGAAQTTTACRSSQLSSAALPAPCKTLPCCSRPREFHSLPQRCRVTEIQHPLSTADAGDIREPGKGRSTGSLWPGGKEGCGSAHTTGWGLVLAGRSRQKNCILLRDTHDHPGSGFTEHPASIPFPGLCSAPAWDIPLVA